MLKPNHSHIRLLAVMLLFGIWEMVALVVDNPVLAPHIWQLITQSYPSFALFVGAPPDDFVQATKTLFTNAFYTAMRALAGLGIGSIFGVLAGLASHFFQRSASANKWILSIIRNAPLFAMIPLWLYWFSGSEFGIISYIAFAVFVFVSTGCYEAVLNIPKPLIWQGRLLGANRMSLFRTVVIPAILPELANTFRWIAGLTLAFSLGAEYLSSNSAGLGSLTYRAYLYANVGQLLILATIYWIGGTCFLLLANFLSARFKTINQSMHL